MPQFLLEVGLPPVRGLLAPLDGLAPAAPGAQRGKAVRQAARKPGELLHRRLDGEAHRPDSLVDCLHGVDRAVSCLIELVELRVHPVDLSEELAGSENDQTLDLRRILWAVVDDVQVDGDRVRLVKKVAELG